MQLLSNALELKKKAELEYFSRESNNDEDGIKDVQMSEIMSIFCNAFVGLIREGLQYNFIKNNITDAGTVRLTIDGIQYDCPAIKLKEILGESYTKLINEDNAVCIDKPIELTTAKSDKDKSKEKTKKELELEKELEKVKRQAQKEAEELKYAVAHDSLTGLKNKKAFLDDVKIKPAQIVVSIDLNGLKYANDNFGHSAGDTLIKNTAAMLKSVFPHCCYRTGGDEFMLILTSADSENFDENINNFKEQMYLKSKDSDFKYTASIGHAVVSEYKNVQAAVEAADKNMYKNKEEFYASQTKIKKRESVTAIEDRYVTENKNDKVHRYNYKYEKIKDISTFVYDAYDFELVAPGSTRGEKFKAVVFPLKMSENDNHPDIAVLLMNNLGVCEKYASHGGRSSIQVKIAENELLVRGYFSNGNFQTKILVSGSTMSMGYNINIHAKNEYRSIAADKTNYGHVVFKANNYIYHIVPLTTVNNYYGIADAFICIESEDNKDERTVISTAENGVTIFKDDKDNSYQIVTYWKDDILCADVIKSGSM